MKIANQRSTTIRKTILFKLLHILTMVKICYCSVLVNPNINNILPHSIGVSFLIKSQASSTFQLDCLQFTQIRITCIAVPFTTSSPYRTSTNQGSSSLRLILFTVRIVDRYLNLLLVKLHRFAKLGQTSNFVNFNAGQRIRLTLVLQPPLTDFWDCFNGIDKHFEFIRCKLTDV